MIKEFKWMLCAAVISMVTMPMLAADDDEQGEDTRPIVSIDKREIVNKTDNPKANFRSLIDRLNNDLVETGLYRVMSMEDAVRVFRKQDEGGVVFDENLETKVKAPGFFVSMVITTYGLTSSAGRNGLTGAVTKTENAKIELILKVVDARTAETVKSKNIDGVAVGQVTAAASNLREQVLQAATKKACEKIVYELIKLTPFGILDIEDGTVSLDVPGSLKIMGKPITPGTKFVVSKKSKGKKSKRTGKVTYSETKVAVVEITSVGEDSCSAKILEGKIEPIGDDEDTQYDPYIVKINEVVGNKPQPDPGPGDGTPTPPF